MANLKILNILVCFLLITSGCIGIPGDEGTPTDGQPIDNSSDDRDTATRGNESLIDGSHNNSERNSSVDQNIELGNYTTSFVRRLRQDGHNISDLNIPRDFERYANTDLDIRSFEKKGYSPDGERLNISINTNSTTEFDESLRKITFFYAYTLNESIQDGNEWTLDELTVLTYVDGELGARNRIPYSWAYHYLRYQNWDFNTTINDNIYGTTEYYRDGGFETTGSVAFENRLETEAPDSITIHRVDYVSDQVFVDYSTETDPEELDQRMDELTYVIREFGEAAKAGDFEPQAGNIWVEEKLGPVDGEYDTLGWVSVNRTDAVPIATGELSAEEARQLVAEKWAEADRTNK